MSVERGYCSVIQFCPDLGRFEAANIGVLLFCPESGFLEASLATNNRRAARFFGREGHDWKRLDVFKKGFADRLRKEHRSITTVEDLQQFIATRGNQIQISNPKPVKVFHPTAVGGMIAALQSGLVLASKQPRAGSGINLSVNRCNRELERLFDVLVGSESKTPGRKGNKRRLVEALRRADLSDKIAFDVHVTIPVLEEQREVPIGFQNGRFNLVTPVSFLATKTENIVRTVSKYAVEGRSLYEDGEYQDQQLRLNVVGAFRPDDNRSVELVHRILREHEVTLYRLDNPQPLIDKIRDSGKDIVSGNSPLE